MNIKNCKRCHEINDTPEYKYCSHCRKLLNGINKKSYNKNRKKRIEYVKQYKKNNIEKSRKWNKKAYNKFKKENPERLKELMKNDYKRNKQKYLCRRRTNSLLNKKMYKPFWDKFKIKYKCKICKSKNNLEIHHKIYPDSVEKIVKAINDKKIYYLCFYCHRVKF